MNVQRLAPLALYVKASASCHKGYIRIANTADVSLIVPDRNPIFLQYLQQFTLSGVPFALYVHFFPLPTIINLPDWSLKMRVLRV